MLNPVSWVRSAVVGTVICALLGVTGREPIPLLKNKSMHYTHYNTKYCIFYSSTFVNVANVNLCYGDPAVVMKM